MKALKALTIRQPWAWAIMQGWKKCENRTWTTGHRGPLLIHAGVSEEELGAWPVLPNGEEVKRDELVFGAILGVARLTRVERVSTLERRPAEFVEGPWGWMLEGVVKFKEPLVWRGAQGLWEVEAAVVREHGERVGWVVGWVPRATPDQPGGGVLATKSAMATWEAVVVGGGE